MIFNIWRNLSIFVYEIYILMYNEYRIVGEIMGKIDNYQKIYEIIESDFFHEILKRGRRFNEEDSEIFWYVDIQDFEEYGFDKDEEEFLVDCLQQKDIVVYDQSGNEYINGSNNEVMNNHGRNYENKKDVLNKLRLYHENGDINLRNELVMDNMQIVERVAKKISLEYSVSYDELVQMGAEHLIKIIDEYNLELKDEFTHYCYMKINRYLVRDVINMFVNNGMSNKIIRQYLEIKKYIENMYGQTVEENPRLLDEIIDLMVEEQSKREVAELESDESSQFDFSNTLNGLKYRNVINANLPPIGIEDLLEQYSIVVSGGELAVENQELIEKLHEVIGTLSERDQLIIKMKYGLDDGMKKSAEEIAKKIGRTTSYVHQKVKDILRKLRYHLGWAFGDSWKFGKSLYEDLMEHSHDMEYPEEYKKSSRK